eukprot:gene35259-biopygen28507
MLDTVTTLEFQPLPPSPVEAVASIKTKEHEPTEDGMLIATVGLSGTDGGEIVRKDEAAAVEMLGQDNCV